MKRFLGLKKVKKAYPKSKFLENIKNQENQIKQPFVNIKFETSTLPNQPIHLVCRIQKYFTVFAQYL